MTDHWLVSKEEPGAETEAPTRHLHVRTDDERRLLRGAYRMIDDIQDNPAVYHARRLLELTTGLDVESDHGKGTPARLVETLIELTTFEDFEFTTFPNDGMDEMIIQRGIPFVSLCNHHVLPFIGKVHIGYVPKELICGLSKFARVVRQFARSLQVQERLTAHIADYLEEQLDPRGVAVVLEAEHMCMTIRGVQAPGTLTYTAAMRGVFSDHDRTAKAEFLNRINGGGH